jgi:hypothetical protein
MEMRITTIILAGVLLIGCSTDQPTEPTIVIFTESVEQRAYREGYESGKDSFCKQYGLINESEDKIFQYTAEISEKDKERYEQIKMQAYVDGYHAACDSYEPEVKCTR